MFILDKDSGELKSIEINIEKKKMKYEDINTVAFMLLFNDPSICWPLSHDRSVGEIERMLIIGN